MSAEILILLNSNDDEAEQRGLSHRLLCHARPTPMPRRHVAVRLATLESAKPLRAAEPSTGAEGINIPQRCSEKSRKQFKGKRYV